MKVVYGKTLTQSETQLVGQMAVDCDILFDTARLLFYRGITSSEKAKEFLAPSKHFFNDPFLLSGVKDAVERIKQAKVNGDNVLVFGDYDADGVCATTILSECLREFGIISRVYVPEREDGYGLNLQTIEKLSSENPINLLITVDCGISDFEKIKALKDNGIDVIVTDHHEPPEILPDCIKINPKIKNQDYPFDGLCGAGVAYKLGLALIGDNANKALDLVALATVADSMELVSENRDLVVEGLKLFNNPDKIRPAFKYLLGENNRQVTAQTLAYVIAPRVNAGGRMGDAECALNLFTEKDANKVFDLSVKLTEYNIERQTMCENIYKQAKDIIRQEKLDDNAVITVANESWQAGFIGIVAAKLVEDYARPVIVFAGHDGYFKGSARSVDGINIYEAISSLKDVLIAYGGHSQAAGVSVSKENYNLFTKLINTYVNEFIDKLDTERTLYAEWLVEKPLSIRFAREVESMEPFGVGNRRPMFATEVNAVDSLPLKLGSPHYSFNSEILEMLDFNGEKNVEILALPVKKQILFELNLSTFKNRQSLKGYSRYVILDFGDFSAVKYNTFHNELVKLFNNDNENVEYIKSSEVEQYIKNGVLFAISNVENLEKYPSLNNVKRSLFFPENKTGVEIVVSLKNGDYNYDKIVYLDKPLSVVFGKRQTLVVSDVLGNSFLEKINADRSAVIEIYKKLLTLSGSKFYDSVRFAVSNFDEEDVYQAIFSIEVFIELGIFRIQNNNFVFDSTVKNALTNSQLYSKIYTLKESYVRDIKTY